ncbi:MAG: hypothetical protein PPP55_07240 [Halorubrum sp.]
MTSTVLDVTVLLLCVSASVVLLGGTDHGPVVATPEYTAADEADRLSTETATVRYPTSGAEADARRVHATLVELLVMASAAGEAGPNASMAASDVETASRFRTRAVGTVADAIGPQTRIDVRHRVDAAAEPRQADDAPLSLRWGSSLGPVRGGADADDRTEAGLQPLPAYEPIGIGTEPPDGVETTVAVVGHPTPHRAGTEDEGSGRLHVVVRVW